MRKPFVLHWNILAVMLFISCSLREKTPAYIPFVKKYCARSVFCYSKYIADTTKRIPSSIVHEMDIVLPKYKTQVSACTAHYVQRIERRKKRPTVESYRLCIGSIEASSCDKLIREKGIPGRCAFLQ